MNYVWIVEEEGYSGTWYPQWNSRPYSDRKTARNFVKDHMAMWDWEKLRVKKYVRVD